MPIDPKFQKAFVQTCLYSDKENFDVMVRSLDLETTSLTDMVKIKDSEESEINYLPLTAAVTGCNIDIINELIARGADVNAMDGSGFTPLYIAAYYGDFAIVKILLDSGADVNKKNGEGFAPLDAATYSTKLDVVRELINRGANVNEQNEYGSTPLHIAIERNCEDVAKELIKKDLAIIKEDSIDLLYRALSDNKEFIKCLEEDIESRRKFINGFKDRVIHSKTKEAVEEVLDSAKEKGALEQVLFSERNGKTLMAEVGSKGKVELSLTVMQAISNLKNGVSLRAQAGHSTERDPLLHAASGGIAPRDDSAAATRSPSSSPAASVSKKGIRGLVGSALKSMGRNRSGYDQL